MCCAYLAFIEIVNSHLSKNPVTSCWPIVLSETRTRFPTFNRSIKHLQRWYQKYQDQVKLDAQPLTTGRKANPELQETIRDQILSYAKTNKYLISMKNGYRTDTASRIELYQNSTFH